MSLNNPKTFFDFTPKDKTSVDHPLSQYQGKVVLAVNTASKCGFTPQFAGLEKLWKDIHAKHPDDFVILGFPCNQFAGQDPGSNDDIQSFCQMNYGVSFPVLGKTDVNGDKAEPVWEWMKSEKPGIMGLKRVKWNFEKFLIGKDGKVVTRWASTAKPESLEKDIMAEIQKTIPPKHRCDLITSTTMSLINSREAIPSDQLESRQAAVKNRILSHMNADHAASLKMYLQHFCAVPQKQASTAKLTEITTQHMIIESKAGRNLIQFEPPMQSLMEAREKMVELHNEALTGLGLSDTKIKAFAMPNRVWQAVTEAAVILCLVTFPFRPKLLPSSGSFISQIWSVGGLVPGLATLAHTLSPAALSFILVVHTIEAENFARTRLRKHQVPVGSALWCSWLMHAFIGGIACFTRFDELVKCTEQEKQKSAKH